MGASLLTRTRGQGVEAWGKYGDNVEAEVAGWETGQAMKLGHYLKEGKE